jgi:alpha-1,3-mannosyltransferase
MQEVEGVLNGTFDYTHLKGDTGPLVYPAGFVYIYTVLYYVTNHGQNIRLAQYIFAVLYIALLCLVFRIYIKSKKVPPYVLVLTCCSSYRIHSIFVLRLFNDPVAMVLFYASVNLFLDSKWSLASLFYSMAVSVKMNILLFSPAILLTYLICLGLKGTLTQLTICASVQILLGIPFILTNPIAYIRGAFNLGRVFLYEWTVNWRFLPEDIFTNSYFHVGLLVLHITLLLFFYSSALTYLQSYATLIGIKKKVKKQLSDHKEKVNMDTASQLFLLPLFIANLIGIACSRSLHYQFYVWYFHSLPYLLWSTRFTSIGRLCILGIIEMCWNTFPSTCLSSMTLHLCHIIILLGLAMNRPSVKVQ